MFLCLFISVKNCLMPVGVEDDRIPDEAFTASSYYSASFLPNRARLNLLPNAGKYCWAARHNNVNQWLQVWNYFSDCLVVLRSRKRILFHSEWVNSIHTYPVTETRLCFSICHTCRPSNISKVLESYQITYLESSVFHLPLWKNSLGLFVVCLFSVCLVVVAWVSYLSSEARFQGIPNNT